MSVGDILERDDDRPAYVRFERRAISDKEATLAAGHHVAKDIDYALITPPYSKDVVEKKVNDWFKQVEVNVKNNRIPDRHFRMWKEAYKYWLEGQEPPVNGTSIKEWNLLSPAQCQNLLSAGCKTIEDLAQCNDEGLRRIGLGAIDLKNKAKAYLQAAKDHGPLTLEVTGLQKQVEQLKDTILAIQEQNRLLSAQLQQKNQPTEERPIISASDFLDPVTAPPAPATLAEQYKQKFGRNPHPNMKEENLMRKLAE